MTFRFRGCLGLVVWLIFLSVGVVGDEGEELVITDTDREHWSFHAVVRPSVPKVKNSGWVRTPIDAFILAKLKQADRQPNPPAEKRDLLRRAFLGRWIRLSIRLLQLREDEGINRRANPT